MRRNSSPHNHTDRCGARGAPKYLFADNGGEFTGRLVDLWAYHQGVRIDFSRPGKPTDKAYIETFNGSFVDECLNLRWFASNRRGQAADRGLAARV